MQSSWKQYAFARSFGFRRIGLRPVIQLSIIQGNDTTVQAECVHLLDRLCHCKGGGIYTPSLVRFLCSTNECKRAVIELIRKDCIGDSAHQVSYIRINIQIYSLITPWNG